MLILSFKDLIAIIIPYQKPYVIRYFYLGYCGLTFPLIKNIKMNFDSSHNILGSSAGIETLRHGSCPINII